MSAPASALVMIGFRTSGIPTSLRASPTSSNLPVSARDEARVAIDRAKATEDLKSVQLRHQRSGMETPAWLQCLARGARAAPPFGVVIVSELSRIGRDTVRTPAAILQLEEAGVEIRSYLTDTTISLADE
jgi:hypothetical protein